MIYNRRRVGAPPGLTVHWLVDELHGEFVKAYNLSLNRKHHNYFFTRYRKRTLIDVFIVVRTSKRCYRVMYFNADFNHFQYFSSENYRECADKMKSIYHIFKSIEEAEKKPKEQKNRQISTV